MRIALISCSKEKKDYTCPAKELYSASNLFTKQYQFAKKTCDKVYIISAKYGLLNEDEEISPYDVTLKGMNTIQKEQWAGCVADSIKSKEDINNDTFVILAGRDYYEHLIKYLKNYELPLEGLKLGERLKKLDSLLNKPQHSSGYYLHDLFSKMRRYTWDTVDHIPFTNGIYIVFEKGQNYEGMERIVRVGTHTSANRLKQRLKDHFLKENKDGSIFRKNVGKAILNKRNDPYLKTWEINTSKPCNKSLADWDYQKSVEHSVSEYMRKAFSFTVFEVNEADERLRFEEGIIATLNHDCNFRSSIDWLGNYSPEELIRKSGMWLKQGLDAEDLSPEEIEVITKYAIGDSKDTYKSPTLNKSAGKYTPLYEYFKNCNTNRVELSFDQIEMILEFKLPDSAYKYAAWWSNPLSHIQAAAWENAGYKATNISDGIIKQKMLFSKQS